MGSSDTRCGTVKTCVREAQERRAQDVEHIPLAKQGIIFFLKAY
jgi:hypothetical protein